MRERVIERYLFEQIKQLGGMCIKMEPRYAAGIPDRLILFNSDAIFVEVKAPGKKPTQKQILFHKRLDEQGIPVYIIDSKQGVDDLVEILDSDTEWLC